MNWQLHNWVAVDWIMAGRGHVVFDIALTLLMIGGLLLNGALLKSKACLPPKPPARTVVLATRRIRFGGYLIFSLRYVFVLTTSGDILITIPSEIALSLLVAADCMVAALALLGYSAFATE